MSRMDRPDGESAISSFRNPLVKKILGMRRSRARKTADESIVEGFPILRVAIEYGVVPSKILFHSNPSLSSSDRSLLRLAHEMGSELVAVTQEILQKVSVREGPMGCVAIISVPRAGFEAIDTVSDSLILLAGEALEKPGNVGALVRTASAAGAAGILMADAQTDPFAPPAIHASLGAVFASPIVTCSTIEAVGWLNERRVTVVAATPGACGELWDTDLSGRICIAVGNEHRGLSDKWLGSGVSIRIPISGPMNSLNVTTAAGIILFEAVRQRSAATR